MPFSTAHVTTDDAARLIGSLVAHGDLGGVAEVGGDGRGLVRLPYGECVLSPKRGRLTVIAAAVDVVSLERVRETIAGHLVRSGGADGLVVAWSAPVAGDEIRIIDPVVEDYLLANCAPADDVQRELIAETREATGDAAGMQISLDEGALLTMLVRMTGARRAVEVGVFTGHSSLCIARGLPEDGTILACDVSTEWTAIARRYWERAGVDGRIDLRIGPALETLRALPDEPAFDFAFIDADKPNYPAYYEEIVPRLTPGGLVVLDNVFLGGRVFDPACRQEGVLAMRRVNEMVMADDRVESVMLPVRDGVTLARRR